MPEEICGQKVNQEPVSEASIQTPVQPLGNQEVLANSINYHANSNQDESSDLALEIKSGEKWLIGIGIATLLINSVIAFIYWGQLKSMRKSTQAATNAAKAAQDTLNEMKTGSGATDTHTLALQAVTQATKTTEQAEQTKRLADSALKQTIAANSLAVQAQRSADYAQKAIETNIESERPWVGVDTYPVDNFTEGQTAKVTIDYVNTGKRPAMASIVYAAKEFVSLPSDPSSMASQTPSVAFILPGGHFAAPLEYPVELGLRDRLKRERKILFFVAEIVYTDAGTNKSYITHFCAFYSPSSKAIPFPLCSRYNEAR